MMINNLRWKVCFSDNMKEDLFGQTNYETLTIYLRKQVCDQSLERTLIHEIVHAYCYSYGLLFFESYDREQLCEFLAHNILNIIKCYDEAIKELSYLPRD